MKRTSVASAFFCAIAILVSGCTSVHPPSQVPAQTHAALPPITDGPTVARHLQKRFDEANTACGSSPPLPAVLCSGVLVRATSHSTSYHAWDPNPNNPNGGGVSFSWMRQDATFRQLARGAGNGFVLLPKFFSDTPGDGYYQMTVLCAYPMDGFTDKRHDKGCGEHWETPGKSGPCQSIGVTTGAAWKDRYVANKLGIYRCGFRLVQGTPNSADAFAQIPVAMRLIGADAFNEWNEVVIQQWPQGIATSIPIEAFFYVSGTSGLSIAKYDQKDFYNASGRRWVPIIRVSMPTSIGARATFTYAAADQEVPYP